MTSKDHASGAAHGAHGSHEDEHTVEMPRATIAPLVVSLGVTMMAAGVVFGPVFLLVGVGLLATAIGMWVKDLLPGAGHVAEPRVKDRLPDAIEPQVGTVEHLQQGMPGYRLRLPVEVQPISAGVKGGLVGALLMPIPAALYAVLSGHGIWYPLNLLSGTVLPGVQEMPLEQLENFHLTLFVFGVGIHITMSLVLGLIYGVLLPMLPSVPQAISWGGLLAPLLWSGVTYGVMGQVNPVLQQGVDWPWFVASQFVYGITLALVYMEVVKRRPGPAGLLGGLAGAITMPLPAVVWSLVTGRGLWHPVNLLAAMAIPGMEDLSPAELQQFRWEWLLVGLLLHLAMSLAFGLLLGLVLHRLPRIPGQLAWGGLVLPLLWTALSFGLMGIINPVLQENVDWPWFVVSQFVFGLAVAVVVMYSEMVAIPPAGSGLPEEPIMVATEESTSGDRSRDTEDTTGENPHHGEGQP